MEVRVPRCEYCKVQAGNVSSPRRLGRKHWPAAYTAEIELQEPEHAMFLAAIIATTRWNTLEQPIPMHWFLRFALRPLIAQCPFPVPVPVLVNGRLVKSGPGQVTRSGSRLRNLINAIGACQPGRCIWPLIPPLSVVSHNPGYGGSGKPPWTLVLGSRR